MIPFQFSSVFLNLVVRGHFGSLLLKMKLFFAPTTNEMTLMTVKGSSAGLSGVILTFLCRSSGSIQRYDARWPHSFDT